MPRRPVLLALIFCVAAGGAAARPLDVRDLVALDRVSAPQVSPDGGSVAFQVREADVEAGRVTNGIWLRSLDSAQPPRRMTTRGTNSTAPRWAPDGRSLYFLSSRGGKNQVWQLLVAGGEARQVTDYPLEVGSFLPSPDGRRLAVSMEVFPGCADLACSRKRLDEAALKRSTGAVYDKLFVRHWDTWKTGTRSQLFIATLDAAGKATGEPVHVSRGIDGDVPTKPFGDDAEYAFSPDGKRIAFTARIAGRTEAWSTNLDLFIAPADGSASPRNLTDANEATDVGPVFSRDGRTLYYRAMRRAGFESDRLAVMALDAARGGPRELAAGWDRSAESLALSRDGATLYALAADLGEQKLFALDPATGKVDVLARGGTIDAISVGDDEVVIARDTLASPTQLFRLDRRGSETRLTDFNARRLADIDFGTYEQFSFPGWNDETVHGYVVRPWNFQAGKRYPVAYVIHGGPQNSMGDHFHYRWNPQTYAGRGYAVVFIDFHGSRGYGQAFMDSITGDWGGKPLVDLQKGLGHALGKYPFLDGSRVCALGASYGGYMTNWIAGNWSEPFKCLVSHDGIFDNRSMSYSTEEIWFDQWERQGTPWEQPANFEKHNPVAHVGRWRVPMLVIHGALDYRIPLEQGLAAFTALQRRGVESRFLMFPDENHWVLKPHNSILWHDTVNAWLDRWIGEKKPPE